MINWDAVREAASDQRARARLPQATVGPDADNAALTARRRHTTVTTINGRAIRPVQTRCGLLYSVGEIGMAFATLAEAEAYAHRPLTQG